jgi:hypothetical protein
MPFTTDDWEAGISWEEYLDGVEKHAELWHHHWKSAQVDDLSAARLGDLPGPRRVLILTEDWCGDAVRSVPQLVMACEEAQGVEVRLIDIRSRPGLMERHRTRGGNAIPVAIVQDEEGRELGWWGPRPAALQTILRQRTAEFGKPKKEEMGRFYAPIMGWYKKDAGRAVLDEFLLLLERG